MRDDLKRQDRNGVRTASELQRRYKFGETEKTVGETTEAVSSLNAQFNNKVDKIPGKGLSTNDFSNTYKHDVEENTTARHTHTNKTVLDGITQAKVNDWNTAKIRTNAVLYDLSTYKVSDLTILRSSCIKKNNRVVINFVGTINITANVTTTLFNLPSELQPAATKDFILFGSTNDNDGYIGYGHITNAGLTQVRFSQAITSYIIFNLVYDLD